MTQFNYGTNLFFNRRNIEAVSILSWFVLHLLYLDDQASKIQFTLEKHFSFVVLDSKGDFFGSFYTWRVQITQR